MINLSYGMPQLMDVDGMEENFQLCKELGLDFVELNCNLPMCQPETMNVQYLNRLKQQYGVSCTIRLPEDLDLGHFNRRVREAHLKVLEEAIGVADRLGCKILNIHMNSGMEFKTPEGEIALYEKYESKYLDNIRASLELVDIWLGGTGVQIAIENTGVLDRRYIQKAVNELLKSGRFCLTFDVGHDYIACHKDQPFILNHRALIKHLHLHDATLERDHQPLYTGDVKIDEGLKLALENKTGVLIEVKTKSALETSVAKLKEKGYIR